MANAKISVKKVFKNLTIPKNGVQRYAVSGLSPDDYYSFSVSSSGKAFLFVESGWYGINFNGPQCRVTNQGEEVKFDLFLMTSSTGNLDDVKAELID